MADKPGSQAERADRILDALADYIESATGDELLEDARHEGRDPTQIAAHVRNVLQQAVKTQQQGELKKAREGYDSEVASMRSRRIHLPAKAEVRRSWLAAVFVQQPQLRAAFTMQNRDFSDLTDEEIEAHLRKLEILGVLKDVKLPDDNG